MTCKRIIFMPRWRVRYVVAILLLLPPLTSTKAANPELVIPIDCDLTTSCHIQNYIDHNPSHTAQDYTCGNLVYDGHTGTDFALADRAMMNKGVAVLAAAAGTVARMRDGIPDKELKKEELEAAKANGLGNAVVIDHGDGWMSYYGHMRQGSLRVQQGQKVTAGQPIGLVGLSGLTEFPHVHFELRKDGKVIDPFIGSEPKGTCSNLNSDSLWSAAVRAKLAYRAIGLLGFGFANNPPDYMAARRGDLNQNQLPINANALILWSRVFGLGANDIRVYKLWSPSGALLLERQQPAVGRHKAEYFEFVGKGRDSAPFAPGKYTAEFSVKRPTSTGEKTILTTRRDLDLR